MESFLLENQYQLAWAEYGATDGEPVFYFHGMPGSQLEAQPADAIALDLGIRLITPDRPGYGYSEAQDNFSLLDWPNAVSQLADKLNLNRFSILGFSGGGPYALACAHKIADRINQLTLVSSPAPFDTDVMQNHISADFKPLYELAAADYSAAIEQISQMAPTPESLLNIMQTSLPPADRELFNQKHFQKQYLENLTISMRNGVNGIVNDLRNIKLPWQFNLQEIQAHVDIWHGRNDINVGFSIAEYLADSLNNVETHFQDNAGHYFLFSYWHDILKHVKTQG